MSTDETDSGELFPSHPDEPHADESRAQRLNWLRAGVLGANDGIVSVAAVVVGVASATHDLGTIVTAGVASLVGGAVSMALGEYVSVSSQSDSELALIEKERRELAEDPEAELEELSAIYQAKGLSHETAHQVAKELTEHDVLQAHLEAELGITESDIVSPWQAAFASAVSFTTGGVLPMLAIWLPGQSWRIPTTFVTVLVARALTGWTGAYIGGSNRTRAAVRVVIGGALALAATFAVGQLFGMSGIA
ncbi:MAG: VIT1/CCC1 transporter family protein [Nocardioidaceae bacterium]